MQYSNRIGGVMVSTLASSVERSWIRCPDRVKPKTKIDICCFSTKYAALRKESKDWLTQNQNNLSEWVTCLLKINLFSQ